MIEKKIQFLEISGNHYSVGYRIGKKTSSKIITILENSKNQQESKNNTSIFLKILSKFKVICKKRFPNYYQELEGISDGAEINFDELFAFNVREVKLMLNLKNSIGGCTTCILPKEGNFIVGHNEDARIGNDVFILHSKIKSEPKNLSVCYYGTLPGYSVSVNEKGLFQLSNFLESKNTIFNSPFSFLSRSTMKISSVKEAVNYISESERSSSEAFTFLKKQDVVCIETSEKDSLKKRINTPFVHTNHFVFDKMKKYQKHIDTEETATLFRREKAQNMLNHSKANFNSFKKILSNHEAYPKSICQHEFKDFKTIATIIFNTNKKELHVCKGNPCTSKFYKFSI